LDLIFLTYINRSGSTYLAQLLSASDEVLVCPEAEILVHEFLEAPDKDFFLSDTSNNRLGYYLAEDWKLKHWGLKLEDLEFLSSVSRNIEAFRKLLSLYRDRIKPGATKIIFKAERLIYLWKKLEKASQLSGNKIKLIAVIRDPRGIYASQKNTIWPDSDRPFSRNLIKTGILWYHYVKKILHLISRRINITLIRYEDLIKNPEGSLDNIAKRIRIRKISIQPDKGDFYDRIPVNQKPIHGNIRSQPIREKENEWKDILNNLEIDLIQSVTGKAMKEMGYHLEKRKTSIFRLLKVKIPGVGMFYFNQCLAKIFFKINRLFHGRHGL